MFEDNQQQPAQPEQTQPTAEQTAPPAESAAPEQAQSTPPAAPAAPAPPAVLPVKTTQEERIWAAIGYVAFLGVVTLAMVPKSEFCKKHASQGLVIFAVWFVGLILLAAPSFISAIGGIVLLGATVIGLLGIVKAIQSFEFKFPILSSIAAKVPTDAIIGSATGKTPPPAEKPAQPDQPAPPASAPADAAPEAPAAEEPKETPPTENPPQ